LKLSRFNPSTLQRFNESRATLRARVNDSLDFLTQASEYCAICARGSAGQSNGFLIEEELFALVFAALHFVADARYFGHSAFSARGAELRRFAAEDLQAVENDRRKGSASFTQRQSRP
jgi:hypothetical protein